MSEQIVLTKDEQSLSERLEQVIQFGGAVSSMVTASGVIRSNAEFLKKLARIGLHYRQRCEDHQTDASGMFLAKDRELSKLRDLLAATLAREEAYLAERNRLREKLMQSAKDFHRVADLARTAARQAECLLPRSMRPEFDSRIGDYTCAYPGDSAGSCIGR